MVCVLNSVNIFLYCYTSIFKKIEIVKYKFIFSNIKQTNTMVLIYSIEGNIGSGKSTLVSHLKDTLQNIVIERDSNNHEDVTIFSDGVQPNNIDNKIPIIYLQEPVDEWADVKDKSGEPILTKFYKDQEKYAFSFQMMAYISRTALLRKTIRENPHSIIICERSVFTDHNVFAKMLHDDEKIEEVDYIIYKKWFDEFIKDTPISCSFYLKVTPENCYKRVAKRAREGEVIPIEYLQKCGEYHDNWLCDTENTYGSSSVIIDGNTDNSENPEIMNVWKDIIANKIVSLVKGNSGSL